MKLNLIALFLILTLATVLRVYGLNTIPIELFGDEIDVGLQANSMLNTGNDYFGNKLPLMFQSFSEYRLPVFIYSAVPFVAIFGLNEWGVRLPAVFWGVLGIIGLYLLCKKLFNEKIALISALFLTLSPWHLQYSRQGGIESVALLTIIIFAVWAFSKGIENYKWLILSITVFILSIYTYATAALFSVPFILMLGIFYWKKIKIFGLYKLGLIVLISFLLILPYFYLYTQGKSGARFATLSVGADTSLTDEINLRRKQENNIFSKLFHNKPLTYFYEASGNYLKAISPEFLFFKGDPILRHSVSGMGELYLFEAILVLFGLMSIIKNKPPHGKIILAWLLLAPLSSSLTRDGGYHASRLILMLPPLLILNSLGFKFLWSLKNKLSFKFLILVLMVLAIVNISSYFHRYFVDWPKDSWRFWQTGFKETLLYLKQNDQDFTRVYLNNTYEASLPRFLFWYRIDPYLIQQNVKNVNNEKNITIGFNGFKITKKYYFGTTENPGEKAIEGLLKDREVYMVSARDEGGEKDWRVEPPSGLIVLKTVVNPFNEPIFYIVKRI